MSTKSIKHSKGASESHRMLNDINVQEKKKKKSEMKMTSEKWHKCHKV